MEGDVARIGRAGGRAPSRLGEGRRLGLLAARVPAPQGAGQ